MAQLHVTRVKREFREIISSEEVSGRELVWLMTITQTGPCML